MAKDSPRRIAITVGRPPSVETRYTVNIDAVRDKLTTGPANLLLWGDSICSTQAQPRLPTGIALEWAAPNGIAGWFVPTMQSAAGSLTNFLGTKSETYSWPFVGFDHTATLAAAGFTVTDYATSSNFATSEVLSGVVSPLPKSCRKFVKSGVWNFPVFQTLYMGGQGVCQTGRVWAAGDWITGAGANEIRVGMVHLANSLAPTTTMRIFTQEGFGSSTAADGPVASNTITPTAPATAAVEIAWASLAAASVNTPFGTASTEPGLAANPVFFQYEGIGTVNPGDPQTAADIVAAGNADWTGSFRIATTRDANNDPTPATTLVLYGTIIEDTANTTGLYVDNLSFSGDTIRTQLDGATTAQMAAALNLNTARPINWVLMQIGENHTAAEWDGGNINETLIESDLRERIARVNAGWDAAGLPRGLITLVSPWETVGGTKSGSAWYTTVAGIMRKLAKETGQISFIDLRQMFADRFSAGELYDASRTNAHMNILSDGVHPSLRGERVHARFLWQAIMGGIDQ